MSFLAAIVGLCWSLAAASASATCLVAERLTGVNLAGAEFGKLPGTINFDYMYPSRAELAQMAAFGANTIRLPIRWERIRPSSNGLLNPGELQNITATVAAAKDLGLCIIIDLHNYAKYYGVSMKENTALKAAFTDTWLRLAAALPDTRHVALGLMNEPIGMSAFEWAQTAQNTLNELRKRNHAHLVLVAGGRWSGGHDWFAGKHPDNNAAAFAKFTDPKKNYAIEIHQYADSDYSGTHKTCIDAKDLVPIFTKLRTWAVANAQPLFLGEFGVAANARCLSALNTIVDMTKDGPWLGWTYWAAGRWWGDYMLAVSLKSLNDSSQWGILNPALKTERARAAQGTSRRFASAAAITTVPDLTDTLRTVTWTDGDARSVVDLHDAVQQTSQARSPMTLIRSIQLLDQYEPAGNGVSQRSNGEVLISAEGYSSTLLPVRVAAADGDEQEGSYVNADGDLLFVTSTGHTILGYPTLRDKAGFSAVLATLGLHLGYDERANIVGEPIVAGPYHFSARPDVTVLPAKNAQPGIRYASVAGLPNATLASVVFEDEYGDLVTQAIVPVPADWMLLKASLAELPGISAVQIDALGVISVLRDGLPMRGRSGFRVTHGPLDLAQQGRVLFQPAGDMNGDGRADFMMIYPNGYQQLLLIYPASN